MKDVSTNQGRTVLFVSHNMSAIQSLCNSAIFLQNGRFVNMGESKQLVRQYLSERNNITNYKEYSKYLKFVKIEQQGDTIIINAKYDLEVAIDIPHFGFVLYNNEGIPIYGSNPTLDNVQLQSRSFKNGEINVEINEPKLIDGEYIVSIWFGDSKVNLLEDIECLTLEVSGMTSNKQYNQSVIGNIVPKIKWNIS